ncbi:protein-disulfide reductase DsbD domain-containing protein [Parasphingopyxis sp.]|uniref:protein-disulfide reductase DsbD family protein n=1 Tax=Parasphingopyxis sp. TaxID=1920299 RepID=UPI00261CE2C2|nr:protein-disulfide reductase DsbD domain-containing protein [Parasphingopyxis sp.]
MRFSALQTIYGLVAAFFCLLPAVAPAQVPRENAIQADLLAETDVPTPGQTFTIAIRMRPDEGWHGYWLNPGEAGLPNRFDWTLPDGVSVGELRYPVPERLSISGIMNYIYYGEYAMLVDVTLDENVAPGTALPLRAEGQWLACTDEICVPEDGPLAIDLVTGSGAVTDTAVFDAYRATMPRPLGSEATFEVVGDTLRLGIPFPAAASVSGPYFFSETDRVLDYSAEQRISRNGDMLIVEVPAENDAAEAERITGLIKIGEHDGLMLAAVPGAVPAAGEPISGEPADSSTMSADIGTVLLALGGAILGGLLLNIMPCVFPILSLKALSLAKAGGEERAVRRDALAYTAGVIIVCLGLGAALLGLRAGGAAAGWAFQLQDPRMILFLLLLVTAIALNLAGLFEVPSLSGGGRFADKDGAAGSFFTGALAAFVATPCTGPFMAAALGAALVVPTAVALAIFAGLGLGLALPFLLLAYVPALRAKLPKPGPWMERFRHIMAVPMFLTALALGWILGRQTGVNGMTLGIAAALGIALMLWWAGNRQVAGKRAWLPVIPALIVVLAALAVVPPSAPASAAQAESGVLDAEMFTEARLAELRGEGRPVFVYFTADWCITCKANEAGALSRAAVAEHFEAQNIAVLVGDWTTGDPVIGRFIESHGRSGVPLYLFYGPTGEPEILPQILTVGMLTELSA